MTEQERKDYWLDLMGQQAQSGLSIIAFCERREISRHRFYYWRKRLGRSNPSKGFIQLIPAEHQERGIRIYPGNPLYIEVESGFDYATLQSVVKALSD